MDYIDELFTTGMLKKQDLSPAICAALSLTKKTLNRYYSLTDSSELYRIAMGSSSHMYSLCINLWMQFFILGTSSTTSNMPAGQPNGF
jgi:hypothetical protein